MKKKARSSNHVSHAARRKALLEVIARNVRHHRERVGAFQNELAHAAGVSHTYISLIEDAKREPAISILARIASALGVRLSTLLEERSPP